MVSRWLLRGHLHHRWIEHCEGRIGGGRAAIAVEADLLTRRALLDEAAYGIGLVALEFGQRGTQRDQRVRPG